MALSKADKATRRKLECEEREKTLKPILDADFRYRVTGSLLEVYDRALQQVQLVTSVNYSNVADVTGALPVSYGIKVYLHQFVSYRSRPHFPKFNVYMQRSLFGHLSADLERVQLGRQQAAEVDGHFRYAVWAVNLQDFL
jgi:hypothetical protein